MKKRGRALVSKWKQTPKKKAKMNEIELGDSKGEKVAPIKWWHYEIETLILISS